ncbi:hypothetical protein HVPorG_04930 [Roseomonas mucosa]|nr:hypothetical protein HVPorG_04930 [Roseomonas mucosa]
MEGDWRGNIKMKPHRPPRRRAGKGARRTAAEMALVFRECKAWALRPTRPGSRLRECAPPSHRAGAPEPAMRAGTRNGKSPATLAARLCPGAGNPPAPFWTRDGD